MATDYQERMKQEREMRMHEIKVWIKLAIVALFILIGGVGSCMFVRPRYNVWKQEMEGKAEFLLCGDLSANPKAISKEELESLCDGHYIQWLGYRSDVRELLAKSHIMAFPSYYREGVPKSLIEACAIGRPIVTTLSYGCKDTVVDGENGFLIPTHDSESLAERLRMLINDADLRQRMGIKGREKAEREFSLTDVVERHIAIYNALCGRNV